MYLSVPEPATISTAAPWWPTAIGAVPIAAVTTVAARSADRRRDAREVLKVLVRRHAR
ncbi:hypothetical protein P3T27_008135 [Kitasatospora sp. MAA19]|uniref:hypothetical protein n=1 Tax=Kitasatospora sp. MAA19 TaxID=3035090 RepID=UPI0024771743|nr:hypothetical protein [Kitasatospora sp. MAA19]MDH6711377.1 hypothetical protein [Kitasatospora sp. MAA19]